MIAKKYSQTKASLLITRSFFKKDIELIKYIYNPLNFNAERIEFYNLRDLNIWLFKRLYNP